MRSRTFIFSLCVAGLVGGAGGCAGLNGGNLNLNASSGLGGGRQAAPQVNVGAETQAAVGRGTGAVRVNSSNTSGSTISGNVNQTLSK